MGSQSERIYVGGLNPPQLKVSEVYARVRAIEGVEIGHLAVNDENSFFHIDATSTNDGVSAFDLISKKYNNVKWKGCKIVVQLAVPNFLERLKKERVEHQEKLVKTDEVVEPDVPRPKLRRCLRIRQKYGEQSHVVDTKPCQVVDWPSFDAIVARIRKRREKKQSLDPDADPRQTAFFNRGVHLRFDRAGERSTPLVPISDDTEDSSAVDSSDESQQEQKGSYAWSDDDDDDDDDQDLSTADDEADALEKEGSINEHAPIDEVVQSQDDDVGVSLPVSATTNSKTRKDQYQWSDDEGDSSEEDRKNVTNQATEFGAGIAYGQQSDDDYDYDYDSVSNADGGGAHSTNDAATDLTEDVKNNLGVLSLLFPDLEKTAPKEIASSTTKNQPTMPLMQRYDPSKESAKQFLVERKSQDDEDEKKTANEKPSSHDEAVTEEETTSQANASRANVYQQSLLEDVFREARISGEAGGFQADTTTTEQGKEESSGGAFSFQFDLGPTEPPSEPAAATAESGFAFGFSLPPEDPGVSAKPEDGPQEKGQTPNEEQEGIVSVLNKKPRLRGLQLPTDLVDQFKTAFFRLHDGETIREDPEGFRTDARVKSDWLKQRQSLTLDWKRKKKFAQSRLQKKMKFR